MVLEPGSANVRVLFVKGQLQVWNLLREETADGDTAHASTNANDFHWAIIVDASLIWVWGNAGSHD